MRTINVLLVVLILMFGISCQQSSEKKLISEDSSNESILIKNVSIFNGIDSVLLLNNDVLLENGLISKIETNIATSNSVKVIDGANKTLMPGLIDSHVHLSGSGAVPWANQSANIEYNLSAYLYAGITTVYDLGGLANELSQLSQKITNNDIIGPAVYNTHIPITIKNSHPIPLTEQMLPWPLKKLVNLISPTIDRLEEAEDLIKDYTDNDIDYVKIICDQIPPGSPEMSFEQLKALIGAAHKLDKKVFVHIGSPENAITAIKAGADVLAHGVWRGKLTDNQAEFIAKSQVPIIYTLSGFENVHKIHNGDYHPQKIDSLLVPENILTPVTGTKGTDVRHQKVMNTFFEDVSNQSQFWLENFKLLYEKNAPILVGTDSNLPGTYAGSTYYQELDLLKKYGMSNFEILKGATSANAKLFIDSPTFGSIAVGNSADLLLLNGNPLQDLQLVKNPLVIINKGSIIHRVVQ